MNQQSTQKQIIYWNTITLQHLTAITDLNYRKQHKQIPHPYDFTLRDFYFNPNFLPFDYKTRTTFIQSSSQWIKHFASFNQLAYLQSVSFQHQMEKHQFWNRIYKMHIKSKTDLQAKNTVSNIVWTYRLVPISIFLFAAATISRLAGIYKMSLKKQLVGLIASAIIGDFFVRAKKSSQIFYLIPPLADKTLQDERLSIVNKSIVLDGKINEIQFHPNYIDQLINEADKEPDQNQKKLILQAAGYTVVDRVDFQY